jgi:hypothetical protein
MDGQQQRLLKLWRLARRTEGREILEFTLISTHGPRRPWVSAPSPRSSSATRPILTSKIGIRRTRTKRAHGSQGPAATLADGRSQ